MGAEAPTAALRPAGGSQSWSPLRVVKPAGAPPRLRACRGSGADARQLCQWPVALDDIRVRVHDEPEGRLEGARPAARVAWPARPRGGGQVELCRLRRASSRRRPRHRCRLTCLRDEHAADTDTGGAHLDLRLDPVHHSCEVHRDAAREADRDRHRPHQGWTSRLSRRPSRYDRSARSILTCRPRIPASSRKSMSRRAPHACHSSSHRGDPGGSIDGGLVVVEVADNRKPRVEPRRVRRVEVRRADMLGPDRSGRRSVARGSSWQARSNPSPWANSTTASVNSFPGGTSVVGHVPKRRSSRSTPSASGCSCCPAIAIAAALPSSRNQRWAS